MYPVRFYDIAMPVIYIIIFLLELRSGTSDFGVSSIVDRRSSLSCHGKAFPSCGRRQKELNLPMFEALHGPLSIRNILKTGL